MEHIQFPAMDMTGTRLELPKTVLNIICILFKFLHISVHNPIIPALINTPIIIMRAGWCSIRVWKIMFMTIKLNKSSVQISIHYSFFSAIASNESMLIKCSTTVLLLSAFFQLLLSAFSQLLLSAFSQL